MNYLIVLFKNKEKRKIINKFKTKQKALDLFNSLCQKSEEVVFDKRTENGSKCYYELALMEKKDGLSDKIYVKDNLGRTIEVKTDSEDYNIIKMTPYKIEEEFLDYYSKNKIDYDLFYKKYLKKSGLKMLSKLNNKVVLQNDDNLGLFTFKDDEDAERFIDSLEKRMLSENRRDLMLIKDFSFPQKKYLYNILSEKGIPKPYLQRYSTTHPSKK